MEIHNNGYKELLKFQLVFIYFLNAISFMQQSSYKLMARVVIEKAERKKSAEADKSAKSRRKTSRCAVAFQSNLFPLAFVLTEDC
jgi:hypothetical protein